MNKELMHKSATPMKFNKETSAWFKKIKDKNFD